MRFWSRLIAANLGVVAVLAAVHAAAAVTEESRDDLTLLALGCLLTAALILWAANE
jgi:hypothetical protein